jgi:hypothetical protein
VINMSVEEYLQNDHAEEDRGFFPDIPESKHILEQSRFLGAMVTEFWNSLNGRAMPEDLRSGLVMAYFVAMMNRNAEMEFCEDLLLPGDGDEGH